MVSKKLLRELHQIIISNYNRDLNQQELSETANTLVEFFKLLFQIQAETKNSKTNLPKAKSKKEMIANNK